MWSHMGNSKLGGGFLGLILASNILGLIISCSCSNQDENKTWTSAAEAHAEQEADRVRSLPGQDFNEEFAHYSGFVTVDEAAGRALFYWFLEAQHQPPTKPILLWQTGGPGCSSIGFGQAIEIGPFHIQEDGKKIFLNPFSWNQDANLLFIDSPVGAGYSHSNTSSDILNNGDKRAAEDSLNFLLKWFERFPQYKGRDFYIAGASYGGHFVPQLSQAIVKHNGVRTNRPINLKGLMVGNALIDDYYAHLGRFQFLWATGLISDHTFMQLNKSCVNESWIHISEYCKEILETAAAEIGEIDIENIFVPVCTADSSQATERQRVGHWRRPYDPCWDKRAKAYFNLPAVQTALHVPSSVAPSKWVTCRETVRSNWKDSQSSLLDVYLELIHSGLRVWMFSGNADAVVPVTSTRYTINALNLPTTSPLRAWYEDDGQVGGWTQEYQGLTLVIIRGGGHEVAVFKPKEALTMFKSFLAGASMPNP